MTDRNFRFLCDVDGIVADFISDALGIINRTCATALSYEDVQSWEILDMVKDPVQREVVADAILQQGLCAGLKPYPEAVEAVTELGKATDFYYVTAFLKKNPYWMFERLNWLMEHCGAEASQVNFVKDKFIVEGDIFLDDSATNVNNWAEHHPFRLALLWTRPWNASEHVVEGVTRVDSWKQVLGMVEAINSNYALMQEKFPENWLLTEEWWHKPKAALYYDTPFRKLLTDEGTAELTLMLNRIEAGVYV